MSIVCNSCHADTDGIAYRTTCCHMFCPTCANAAFQSSSFCPVCSYQLKEIDVSEVLVGIEITTSGIVDKLLQYLFQNGSCKEVSSRVATMFHSAATAANLVYAQLQFKLEASEKVATKADDIAEQLRFQVVSIKCNFQQSEGIMRNNSLSYRKNNIEKSQSNEVQMLSDYDTLNHYCLIKQKLLPIFKRRIMKS
jgi:hypothetical protein